MSLDLDKRQRAMLAEMGVQVWLPETPVAQALAALQAAVVDAENLPESKALPALTPVVPAVPVAPVAAMRPTVPVPQAPLPIAPARSHGTAPSWSLGEAQPLYAETAAPGAARWLVLAETPAAALMTPVLHGDVGKLLDNMLRAARLPVAGAVLLAAVVRHFAAPPGEAFSVALADLIDQARPDIVLVMGRMASQALLGSTEPLGRLRGQVHTVHGARAVVTYDAAYLLRAPADKAKAWDDLRLAMGLAAAL